MMREGRKMGKGRWRVRAAALVGVGLTFWAALVLMPPELALFDEQHVLGQVTSYGPLEVARNLMRDSHPPLYYWLVQGWWALSGLDRAWGYRVFSVLLGLPALALAFRLGWRVGGERGGLAAVVLMALHPFYLFQLMLIRMYGLVIALGAWLTEAWLGLLGRPSGRRWGIWVAAQGLLLFTHYYGAWLVLAQWVVLLVRRPPGWRRGLLLSGAVFGLFGLWLAQAYEGSMANTVRHLTMIPVRPRPWEVVGHFWANGVVGPLADGEGARGLGVAIGVLAGGVGLARRGRPLGPGWMAMGWSVLVPVGVGALLALRWPFFAARYFAMVFVPLVVILAVLGTRRSGLLLPALLGAQLLGWAGFPLLQGRPLGPTGALFPSTMRFLGGIQDPVLVQAPWHRDVFGTAGFRHYDWPIPEERERVVQEASAFWFVGVSLYRGEWEGWLEAMRATHDVDLHIALDHPIPEYRADVFHLVRKAWPGRWRDRRAVWANGLRLEGVGEMESQVAPGGTIPLVLRLGTEGREEGRWTLFVHLVDGAGNLWTNRDEEPDPPTDRWRPGEVRTVWRYLYVPPDLPPGRYRVVVGWYATGSPGYPRVPLREEAGEVVAVGEVEVVPRAAPWRVGTRLVDGVMAAPPQVVVGEREGGVGVVVRFQWRSAEPVALGGGGVVFRDRGGREVAFRRVGERPDVSAVGLGWIPEVWESPVMRGEGGWGLGWVEIRYRGRALFRRPVWVFPPAVRWSYEWLFLNRLKPEGGTIGGR